MPGWCCCDHWENGGPGTRRTCRSPPSRCATRSGACAASLRLHLAERQRRPAPAEGREDLPPDPEGVRLAQPRRSPRPREEGRPFGAERHEDERPVRVRRPVLLVHRHQARRGARLRHRDQPGPGDPADREPASHAPEDQLWPIDPWWEYHAGGMSGHAQASSPRRSTRATARRPPSRSTPARPRSRPTSPTAP